jgi:hypothetical protein
VATATVRKTSVEKQERRKSARYNLALPVVVIAGQQSLNATSRDVSTGGVYLVFDAEANLLPGTELALTLTMPKEVTSEEEVLIRAQGKAVRVDTLGENGTTGGGVAVIFERRHFLRSNSLYG